MNNFSGHDSAQKGYTRPGPTWENEMNVMSRPCAGLIAWPVEKQPTALLLSYRDPAHGLDSLSYRDSPTRQLKCTDRKKYFCLPLRQPIYSEIELLYSRMSFCNYFPATHVLTCFYEWKKSKPLSITWPGKSLATYLTLMNTCYCVRATTEEHTWIKFVDWQTTIINTLSTVHIWSLCIYLHIHTYYMHSYIHTYIHTYMHACMHVYIHTYIHACIHTHIYTLTHTQTNTHIIHTYIHIYMHTYTQTRTRTKRSHVIYGLSQKVSEDLL